MKLSKTKYLNTVTHKVEYKIGVDDILFYSNKSIDYKGMLICKYDKLHLSSKEVIVQLNTDIENPYLLHIKLPYLSEDDYNYLERYLTWVEKNS